MGTGESDVMVVVPVDLHENMFTLTGIMRQCGLSVYDLVIYNCTNYTPFVRSSFALD